MINSFISKTDTPCSSSSSKHLSLGQMLGIPQISYPDGKLCWKGDPKPWILCNPDDRLRVRNLELDFSNNGKEDILGDSIGELSELTHLTILNGRFIKCLPISITRLSKLMFLDLSSCKDLEQLPANIGRLKSLKHLSIDSCRIKSLPTGLRNRKDLKLTLCIASFAKLEHYMRLQQLDLWQCCEHRSANNPIFFRKIIGLQSLSIQCPLFIYSILPYAALDRLKKLYLSGNIFVFPANLDLDGLTQLFLFDLHATNIKSLPWSITNLPNLRFLFLPWCFRLHTLPPHLNNSIIISQSKHVGKSWNQVKVEMGLLFFHLTAHISSTSSISPCGYLHLEGDLGPWIRNNSDHHSLVRLLDLDLCDNDVEELTDSIGELSELTHLYISGNKFLKHLPNTITTKLKHLSLEHWDIDALWGSLVMLTNLESLHIDLKSVNFPANVDFSLSLRRLSLHSFLKFKSLPDAMPKFSHLKTLDLYNFDLESLPANLSLTRLNLMNSKISSIPRSLLHLEITHAYSSDSVCDGCSWLSLNQLVNLENLSISCHYIKSLPSIGGLHNLQILQLKDCFSLETLPSNLDKLVNLGTLNIVRTRIKSLPYSITKLPNLRHLILPKYFKQEDLLLYLRKRLVIVSFDHTHDMYYEEMGYYDSEFSNTEASNEDNKISTDTRLGIMKIINEQTLPHPPIPAALVPADYLFHDRERHYEDMGCSDSDCETLSDISNDGSELSTGSILEFTDELPLSHLLDSPRPALVLKDSLLTGLESWDMHFEEMGYSNSDCETISEISNDGNEHFAVSNRGVNEEILQGSRLGIIDGQSPSSPAALDLEESRLSTDSHFNGTEDPSGENTNSALCSTQNADCRGKSSQHALQASLSFMPTENEHVVAQLDQQISQCDARNHHALGNGQINENMQKKRAQSKGKEMKITREAILNFFPRNMTLVAAAKELNVSRSTLKRKLKEFNIKWQSSRNAKKKKRVAKSPSSSNVSLVNLRIPPEPAGPEQCLEVFNVANEQTISDQVPYQSNIISNLTPQITVEVPTTASQVLTDGHELNQDGTPSIIREHLGLGEGGESQQVQGSEQGEEGVTKECFKVANQQTLSDHVQSPCNDISNSTHNATLGTAEVSIVQVHTDSHELGRECLNGANQHALSNTIQESISSCSIIVKATYNGHSVRFRLSQASVDELKKEVADNLELELELAKFKLSYQDEDKEWMLMTKNEHFEYALNLLKSSGTSILRLNVVEW